MASRRTKSIGTKVTPEEYAWGAPESGGVTAAADATVLAELLALRAILLNLHFHQSSGTPVTAETMQRLIERADQDKARLSEARLAGADRRGP